jgi:hypothetical protein
VYLLISSLLEFPNEGIFLYFTPQLILHFIQINNSTAWEIPGIYNQTRKAFQHQHLLCSFFQTLGHSPIKSQTSMSPDTHRILSPFCCSIALYYNILRTAFIPSIETTKTPVLPDTPARRSVIERSQMGFNQFEKFTSAVPENLDELLPSFTLSLQSLRKALDFTYRMLDSGRSHSEDLENLEITENNNKLLGGTERKAGRAETTKASTRNSLDPRKLREKINEKEKSEDNVLNEEERKEQPGVPGFKRSEKRMKTDRPIVVSPPIVFDSVDEEEMIRLKEKALRYINSGPFEYVEEKEDIVKKLNTKVAREEDLVFDFPSWGELVQPMRQILRVLKQADHSFLAFEAEKTVNVLIDILKYLKDLRNIVDEFQDTERKEDDLQALIQDTISNFICNLLMSDEENSKSTSLHIIFRNMKQNIDEEYPLAVVRTTLQIIVDLPHTQEDVLRRLPVIYFYSLLFIIRDNDVLNNKEECRFK